MKSYKHYDRCHRLDNGAIIAYNCGEKPISKWTKKIIVAKLFKEIDRADLSRTYQAYKVNKEDVKQNVLKMTKDYLKKKVLVRTEVHRTGNYYRNTKFYRVLNANELPSFVEQCIYKPKEYIQLKLDL